MSHATFATRPRSVRVALAFVLLVPGLLVWPRPTHPGLPPAAAPRTAAAPVADTALLSLVAALDLAPEPAPDRLGPDRHALRQPVRPSAVRLRVDKAARHPLSGPVAVRRGPRLGGPAGPLHLAALEPPEPTSQPPSARPAAKPDKKLSEAATLRQPPPPAPASPARVVAVKNTTPDAPGSDQSPVPGLGHSVLVAGDSLSIYLAQALGPMLRDRPGTRFAAKGKVSSGLARPDFFDWERAMTTAVAASRPDTVVIMIATNDNQTLTRPDGKKIAFGRPGWKAEYTRRVRRLVELARAHNRRARIYWVGAPVMADRKRNTDVAIINAVIARELAGLPGCHFVDVWRTLADGEGHYAKALRTPSGLRTTRTPDGVHLTSFGARLLARATLASMNPTLAALDAR